MTARLANELLYDSEAALRLVDSAIEDFREPEQRPAEPPHPGRFRDLLQSAGPLGLLAISHILARSYSEVVSVLGGLRESRDVLARTSADKLLEVTTATEVAANDILDGLDRSVALVNEMDARAGEGNSAAGVELRNKLRDELFSAMSCLQFQDITTQQLSYASSVLTEMEARLAELATILDPAAFGVAGTVAPLQVPATANPISYGPDASTQNVETRQAIADQIFERPRG
jgi:hypothetical protein